VLNAIVTTVAFVTALIVLPRFLLNSRRGRIKFRVGPSRIGQFTVWSTGLFLRYWMYTFPIAAAVIITMIGFMVL